MAPQRHGGGGSQPNGHGPSPHAVDLNPMDFIENNTGNHVGPAPGSGSGGPPSGAAGNFELDFDKFDMLGEFPDLDHYTPTTNAMMHVGAGGQGPLLSSTAPGGTPPHKPPHGQRHQITDYSPDWAWSEVSAEHGRDSKGL